MFHTVKGHFANQLGTLMSILLELHIPNCVVIARMSIINLAHMIDTQGNIEVGRIL